MPRWVLQFISLVSYLLATVSLCMVYRRHRTIRPYLVLLLLVTVHRCVFYALLVFRALALDNTWPPSEFINWWSTFLGFQTGIALAVTGYVLLQANGGREGVGV